ncbi:uncharacterized protein LOC142355516, partial [Convolutriloba macropyga]|uniref:uncharacterized protein LOC142355516 n=1 Tax=Convolutriloba macropyga TaxID=536237 RepID=UPI003F528C32
MAIDLGVDRSYPWDPSVTYGQLKCLICERNLKTPVVKQLEESGFCAGSRITVEGDIDNFSAGFTIDLISGPAEHSSVASGIPLRIQVSLTQMETYLSRKREGYWEVKDFTPPNAIFPFVQGDRFAIEFVHKNTHVEILVNKKFYTLFKIDPKQKISAIEVSGKVGVRLLRVDNPLTTVVRETEMPIVFSGPNTAICGYRSRSSNKRTLLWPGSQIIINATLENSAKRFQVTFQDGSIEQKTDCVVLQAKFN